MAGVRLEFREGRYFLRGGVPPQAFASLATGTVVLAAAIAVAMGMATGRKWVIGTDIPPEALFTIVVVGFALMQILMRALRTIFSRTVLDPSSGTVTLYRKYPSRVSGRIRVGFESIRYLALSYQNGDRHGLPGRRYHILRLMTEQGEEDLFAVTDGESARKVATEMAGVISKDLRMLL